MLKLKKLAASGLNMGFSMNCRKSVQILFRRPSMLLDLRPLQQHKPGLWHMTNTENDVLKVLPALFSKHLSSPGQKVYACKSKKTRKHLQVWLRS